MVVALLWKEHLMENKAMFLDLSFQSDGIITEVAGDQVLDGAANKQKCFGNQRLIKELGTNRAPLATGREEEGIDGLFKYRRRFPNDCCRPPVVCSLSSL